MASEFWGIFAVITVGCAICAAIGYWLGRRTSRITPVAESDQGEVNPGRVQALRRAWKEALAAVGVEHAEPDDWFLRELVRRGVYVDGSTDG